MSSASRLPGSKHYTLEQLADGVYAALGAYDAGAVCNAGIVDLGEHTLVFDAFQTPQAAVDLQYACQKLTGRSASYVVNSHWHGDHVHGNSVFAGTARIIATEKTRELMGTLAAAEIAEDRATVDEFLASLETQRAEARDEGVHGRLAARISSTREYMAALPALELRLPDITFDERLVFHGSQRTAMLLTYGGGHTGSDAFLYLPDERIAYLADLLFIQVQPWLPDGDPDEWVRILERIEALDIATAVPGHGPLGTLADAPATRQYIGDCTRSAMEAVESGASLEETLRTPIPSQYAGWFYDSFWTQNLRFLYNRIAEQIGQ